MARHHTYTIKLWKKHFPLHTHTHTATQTHTRVNVITTGPVWSVSLSLGLAGCAGPQQLLYYSSRQGSLAEALAYKVQYKRTVGSPRDLAGKSLAKLKPHQPFPAVHANETRHMYSTYGRTSLRTLSALSSLTAHLFPVEGIVGFLELYFTKRFFRFSSS